MCSRAGNASTFLLFLSLTQVLNQASNSQRLLSGVRNSLHFGGVMLQYELTEQLLRGAAATVSVSVTV
jgi:hypothetical protein